MIMSGRVCRQSPRAGASSALRDQGLRFLPFMLAFVFALGALPALGVRLRFDNEFSPPSAADAALSAMRYRAYNRPQLSQYRRIVKVEVQDDNGIRISSGADASMVVTLNLAFYKDTVTSTAEEDAIDAHLVTTGKYHQFKKVIGVAVDDPVEHTPTVLSIETQAVNGIAVFPNLIPLLPSVWITNLTTGAPYTAGTAVLPRACCQLVYETFPKEIGRASPATSEPFQVLHRAHSLELLTALPATLLVDEPLPPLEVRIMAASLQHVDANGEPQLFPLLHGTDTDIDIQLSVAWDKKVFAGAAPNNLTLAGMDLSPLLVSQVDLAGDGVVRNYQDDLSVRLRASLLPGGYYGAIFENIRLRNVSGNVRLNFTMSYPGGTQYDQDRGSNGLPPPDAFSRVGLGFTDYTRVYEDRPEDLWTSDFDIPNTENWVFGPHLVRDLYRDFNDTRLWASSSPSIAALCASITDERRRAWCAASGFSLDVEQSNSPGVLITAPMEVVGRNASQLRLNWAYTGAKDVVANYPLSPALTLDVLDASGQLVTSGPDSSLQISVSARDTDTDSPVDLCDGIATTGMTAVRGSVELKSGVCALATNIELVFNATSTVSGATMLVTSQIFNTTGLIPLGIMLPNAASGVDTELPYRALKMALEQPVIGQNGQQHFLQFGRFPGYKFETHYVDTAGSTSEVIQRLDSFHQDHDPRHYIGPFANSMAEPIGAWAAATMPDRSLVSFTVDTEKVMNIERYPNLVRIAYSEVFATLALTKALAARGWSKLAIIQNKEELPLSEYFYDQLRLQGITILADVSISANAALTGASLETEFAAIKAAGARVIFMAVAGQLSIHVYKRAIAYGVTADNGFQWVGNRDAQSSFDPAAIPDSQRYFAGMLFMIDGYGISPEAIFWQTTAFTDLAFYESRGGLDPFVVMQRGFDYSTLNPQHRMKLRLAVDAVWLAGWFAVRAIESKLTITRDWVYKLLYVWQSPVPMNSGASVTFDEHLGRVGYTGIWLQQRDGNLTALQEEHTQSGAFGPFNPWQPTTAISMLSATADITEAIFNDPITSIQQPLPTYGPNITLTSRTYRLASSVSPSAAVSMAVDAVPVTHICTGGCGGGLINMTISAYEYYHGTCTDPDTCVCIRRTDDPSKAAFIGANCQTPLCDQTCSNGQCAYNNVTGTTGCVCDAGWTDSDCRTALCVSYGCHAVHGSCELPDQCRCSAGHYGISCNETCQCLNGVCNDGSSGTGACDCDDGFWGAACSKRCTCVNGECNDGASGNGQCTSCDAGYIGTNCETPLAAVVVPVLFGATLLILAIVWVVRWYLRRARAAAFLANMDWKLDYCDLQFHKVELQGRSGVMQSMQFHSMRSVRGTGEESRMAQAANIAMYKGTVVWVKPLTCLNTDVKGECLVIDAKLREEIRNVREARHTNVVPFIGACISAPDMCIVSEFASKGALEDILSNPDVNLDWTFRYSILKDIARGMAYLHASRIGSHGRLSSSNCVVDSRWTVKISDYGLPSLRARRSGAESESADLGYESLFYTAPELLGYARSISDVGQGSRPGDIYSFGIIMSEVLSNNPPYYDCSLSARELIGLVSRTLPGSRSALVPSPSKQQHAWVSPLPTTKCLFRPTVPPESDSDFVNLMTTCWMESPEGRPDFKAILRELERMNPQKGEMVDNLIRMLEKYSSNLEGIVAERTAELELEKTKTENLICRMLPRTVYEELRDGKSVKAESFDNVTVLFSDVVGFTNICAQSTPLQVVEMLNALYTCFDSIIEEYSCWKVETIGDAYMVVSGLPQRNGIQHAGEIASLALHLLSAVLEYKIPHMPGTQLQLRVGIHSGPCVAGVVGTAMPRYCLFGDTVNVASRMESGGLALRVHLSETTAKLLQTLGGYDIELRGEREVKGRGIMRTYWLKGKHGFDMPLPTEDMAVSEAEHEFK